MPQVFKTLSQLLDTKRPMLMVDDLGAMAPDVRSVLLDQEFLVPARTATHVTCDACYDDHVEALTNQLASATGLGGRSRAQFDIEKVRKSVSMAVSRDIERIARSHESLGRHLDAAIDSGLTFRYAPERHPDWH